MYWDCSPNLWCIDKQEGSQISSMAIWPRLGGPTQKWLDSHTDKPDTLRPVPMFVTICCGISQSSVTSFLKWFGGWGVWLHNPKLFLNTLFLAICCDSECRVKSLKFYLSGSVQNLKPISPPNMWHMYLQMWHMYLQREYQKHICCMLDWYPHSILTRKTNLTCTSIKLAGFGRFG